MVIISDEAVDTNSLHSALQVVEILFKKFPSAHTTIITA